MKSLQSKLNQCREVICIARRDRLTWQEIADDLESEFNIFVSASTVAKFGRLCGFEKGSREMLKERIQRARARLSSAEIRNEPLR
jgi:hypothetical protein